MVAADRTERVVVDERPDRIPRGGRRRGAPLRSHSFEGANAGQRPDRNVNRAKLHDLDQRCVASGSPISPPLNLHHRVSRNDVPPSRASSRTAVPPPKTLPFAGQSRTEAVVVERAVVSVVAAEARTKAVKADAAGADVATTSREAPPLFNET